MYSQPHFKIVNRNIMNIAINWANFSVLVFQCYNLIFCNGINSAPSITYILFYFLSIVFWIISTQKKNYLTLSNCITYGHITIIGNVKSTKWTIPYIPDEVEKLSRFINFINSCHISLFSIHINYLTVIYTNTYIYIEMKKIEVQGIKVLTHFNKFRNIWPESIIGNHFPALSTS